MNTWTRLAPCGREINFCAKPSIIKMTLWNPKMRTIDGVELYNY